MKIIGFIPSRFNSTRFPGKPLTMIKGKSMIQRVYENSLKSKLLDKVVILTDDDRIYRHCLDFNANILMTNTNCKNGTDRILSIVNDYNYDGYLNIQGDEPFIDPDQIDLICEGILKGNDITTLKYKTSEHTTKNNIKLVCSNSDKVLYFSRSRIPFMARNVFTHIGVYGFSKNGLNKIMHLQENSKYDLDTIENLEQLKWLSNDINIYAYTTDKKTISIDVPEDLMKIYK